MSNYELEWAWSQFQGDSKSILLFYLVHNNVKIYLYFYFVGAYLINCCRKGKCDDGHLQTTPKNKNQTKEKKKSKIDKKMPTARSI